MVDLNGHEAGNGGHSQGNTYSLSGLLYSERGDVAPSETSCQAVFGEMCGYTTTFSLGQRASSLRCRLRFCHSGL
jgi:hypothetical protein